MEQLLTTEQVMQYFNVKDSRTIAKFRTQGLKYIPIGTKDFRYKQKDIEEFAEQLKEIAQFKTQKIPTKRKTKTMNIDFEKRRINLELNKVV